MEDRLRPFCEREYYLQTLAIRDASLPDEALAKSGISAKNLKGPGVQRVLKLACKKEIDAIVVYKLDRIFRSTTDALETTRLFEKWGVFFHSIEETLDTQSAMGRCFVTLRRHWQRWKDA